MLVLSRKRGESIFIGNGIRIVVSEINGDAVRIAIDAPREMLILREELTTRDKDRGKSTPGVRDSTPRPANKCDNAANT